MALLTLGAEATAVNVVLGMTAAADHRGLDDVLRPDVALRAADGGVGTRQGEPGTGRVIELAQVPAIGRVTGSAVLTQGALVGIRFGVAAVAIPGRLTEVLVGVTLPAGDGHV